MPKDDINYKFTENGIVYDFYDVFVPAENFRQPSLLMWGRNDHPISGTNDTGTKSTPVTTFAGGTTWKSVSCGFEYTAAIKTDGTLWTWGRNSKGQLGVNDANSRSTPVTTFAGGNTWKSVFSGGYHTIAIKTDGTLWTWGKNDIGQLGTNVSGNFVQTNVPVTTFAGGNNWKSASGGLNHTAAIKTDGSLWVWGYNNVGQLGTNDLTSRSTPVTTFAGGNDWKQVSGGKEHTAAIKTDGSLWTWGRNNLIQLGINATGNRSTPVTTFAGGNNWKSVSGGGEHTVALKTDGTLWGWGYNGFGSLGTNDGTIRSTPVTTFAGGNNWKQVSCGNNHTAAIKTDGSLWVWGRNQFFQLGVNDFNSRLVPVTTFAGGNNWKSVAGGGYYTAAIKYSPDP